jgi:hypothetical protein
MNATALAELAVLKQGARATWAAGDYPAIAECQLWEVGPRIVRAVGVRPGEDVLDGRASSRRRPVAGPSCEPSSRSCTAATSRWSTS